MASREEDGDIHRGLRNLAGQNNCFLNSALQTLWHLPKFRETLACSPPIPTESAASADAEAASSTKLLPPLQSLFANYQWGDDSVLPADEVLPTRQTESFPKLLCLLY